MRILHIVPATPFGGMQRVVCDLASEQKRQNLEVTVLVIYDGGPLIKRLERNDIPVHVIPGARPSLLGMAQFCRCLRETAPWVVHLHAGLLWSNFFGLLHKRCPWILHAHLYPSSRLGVRERVLERINLRLVDAVIGVSESVSKSFMASPYRNKLVFTVHNGVNMVSYAEPRSHRDGAHWTFGIATRLVADKGVLEFIDVAAAISRWMPEARFALAGDGPLLNDAYSRVASYGLADRFEFAGFVDDICGFWRKIDVAIFTSPREAFGLRLIEPMLMGIPVVAYRSGAGSDEILREGENALVAPLGNVERLAEHAVTLCREPMLSAYLSDRGRQISRERFSIEQMAREMTGIYDRLC